MIFLNQAMLWQGFKY